MIQLENPPGFIAALLASRDFPPWEVEAESSSHVRPCFWGSNRYHPRLVGSRAHGVLCEGCKTLLLVIDGL